MVYDLAPHLAVFNSLHTLVLGDVMLDRFVWGRARRISPEAPVPVVEIERESASPGGAGNAAANFRAMGSSCGILGFVGADSYGAELRGLFEQLRIAPGGLLDVDGFRTIVKTRIVAHGQQMLRTDRESRPKNLGIFRETLYDVATKKLPGANLLFISDYQKGTIGPEVQQLVEDAIQRHLFVGVNAKPTSVEWFRGADLLTLNHSEAEKCIARDLPDEALVIAAGKELLARSGVKRLAITRGESGITLFSQDNAPRHFPAIPVEVYDVAGAGDTAAAALTLALASGSPPEVAAHIAIAAAASVVRKVGVATTTAHEILETYDETLGRAHALHKVLNRQELPKRIEQLRERNQKIVFTNGCFDILHVGHKRYLSQARLLGDVLIIGLNTDESVSRLKGAGRPINTLEDRAEVLSALESVDFVIPFGEDTAESLVREIRPDVYVKGGDYEGREDDIPEGIAVRELGGEIRILPYIEGRSTTEILRRLEAQA